jgi:hypothetical protein
MIKTKNTLKNPDLRDYTTGQKMAPTIYETNNLQAIEYSGVFVMTEKTKKKNCCQPFQDNIEFFDIGS